MVRATVHVASSSPHLRRYLSAVFHCTLRLPITLHRSKWSGPSCVSAIRLLLLAATEKLFCNIQKRVFEMCLALSKPSGDISAWKGLKKATHLRLHINLFFPWIFKVNKTSLAGWRNKFVEMQSMSPYISTCKIDLSLFTRKVLVQCTVNCQVLWPTNVRWWQWWWWSQSASDKLAKMGFAI